MSLTRNAILLRQDEIMPSPEIILPLEKIWKLALTLTRAPIWQGVISGGGGYFYAPLFLGLRRSIIVSQRSGMFFVVFTQTHATAASAVNPLMATLKPQSNGPLYSDTAIGTLAVDGWTVTFGTARRRRGASSLYQM